MVPSASQVNAIPLRISQIRWTFLFILVWLFFLATKHSVLCIDTFQQVSRQNSTCEDVRTVWHQLHANSFSSLQTIDNEYMVTVTSMIRTAICQSPGSCCDLQMDNLAIHLLQQRWRQSFRAPLLAQAAAFGNASSYLYNYYLTSLNTFWYNLDANFNHTYQEFYVKRRQVFIDFNAALRRYLAASVATGDATPPLMHESPSGQLNINSTEKLSDILRSFFGLLLKNIMEAVNEQNVEVPNVDTVRDTARCMLTTLTERPALFRPLKSAWDNVAMHFARSLPAMRLFVNSLAIVREELLRLAALQSSGATSACVTRVVQMSHCFRCQVKSLRSVLMSNEMKPLPVPVCGSHCRAVVREACAGDHWLDTFREMLKHVREVHNYLRQEFHLVNNVQTLPNEFSRLTMSIHSTVTSNRAELLQGCQQSLPVPSPQLRSFHNTRSAGTEQETYYRHMRQVFHSQSPRPNDNPSNSPQPPAQFAAAVSNMVYNAQQQFEDFISGMCHQYLSPARSSAGSEEICWNGEQFTDTKATSQPGATNPKLLQPLPLDEQQVRLDSITRQQTMMSSLRVVSQQQHSPPQWGYHPDPPLVPLRGPLPLTWSMQFSMDTNHQQQQPVAREGGTRDVQPPYSGESPEEQRRFIPYPPSSGGRGFILKDEIEGSGLLPPSDGGTPTPTYPTPSSAPYSKEPKSRSTKFPPIISSVSSQTVSIFHPRIQDDDEDQPIRRRPTPTIRQISRGTSTSLPLTTTSHIVSTNTRSSSTRQHQQPLTTSSSSSATTHYTSSYFILLLTFIIIFFFVCFSK